MLLLIEKSRRAYRQLLFTSDKEQMGKRISGVSIKSESQADFNWITTGFQLDFNRISIRFQMAFNRISIGFQLGFNPISMQYQSGFNPISIRFQSEMSELRPLPRWLCIVHVFVSLKWQSIKAYSPRNMIALRGKSKKKTSPQAKRHKPSLLFTSLTILTFITR